MTMEILVSFVGVIRLKLLLLLLLLLLYFYVVVDHNRTIVCITLVRSHISRLIIRANLGRSFLSSSAVGSFLWHMNNARVDEKAKILSSTSWPRHYAALLQYRELFGHCNVPYETDFTCTLPGLGYEGKTSYAYKGKLGNWLSNQRAAFRGTGSSTLSEERLGLLQKLVDEGASVNRY